MNENDKTKAEKAMNEPRGRMGWTNQETARRIEEMGSPKRPARTESNPAQQLVEQTTTTIDLNSAIADHAAVAEAFNRIGHTLRSMAVEQEKNRA